MKNRKACLFLMCLASYSVMPAQRLFADGTRRAFDQAVADLQNDPDDYGLRRRIIKLSRDLEAPPKKTEELTILEDKAIYLVKSAAGIDDYRAAAAAYKKVTLLAPWDGILYYNQGSVEQAAKLPKDAVRDFKLFLFAEPDAPDRAKVLNRISVLEVQVDKQDQAQEDTEAAGRLADINAAAQKQWQTKSTTSTILVTSGECLDAVGAVWLLLGWTLAYTAYNTSKPGYVSGYTGDFNISYEGKYWSDDTYWQEVDGVQAEEWGAVGLIVGTAVWIAGAVVNPGPFQPRTALLDYRDGKLAWGAPPVDLLPHAQGWKTTLLSAQF